ncbi:MAG: aldehyde dehydrogenase family protein [Chloroflexi bacterium]|nr:MAG: aldehyde dehydrogenase family protein [Chloroflexota bacterium]
MKFKTISPVDGRVYVERDFATIEEIREALDRAEQAKAMWKATPIEKRARYCAAAVDAFVAQADIIAEELAWQMGRPIRYGKNEVRGFEERARYMIDITAEKLADIQLEPKDGFTRFIRREPLGLVLVLAPWNYPYLTAVNSVIPALMAGNVVILKHAFQTPLCAERLADAFKAADLPDDVFQYLHATHEDVGRMIMDERVNFVAFTGSVEGGHAVREAASHRFVGVGLELGGKDPAYVRADADLSHAIENLVDGAMFNSGQSCCAVERIYVDRAIYDQFVEGFVALTKQYKLGDPLDPETTLGPVVRHVAAENIRNQVAEAIEDGAQPLIDESLFEKAKAGTPYVAPQVLVNVDHSMRIMTEETFGPVIGIMPVDDDEEAVRLMNDSEYGLTASVWTQDIDAAIKIGEQIATGTVFMNRCDYLDPALAWTGVKNSGNGVSLSELGYEQLTQPKSFHLRTKTL